MKQFALFIKVANTWNHIALDSDLNRLQRVYDEDCRVKGGCMFVEVEESFSDMSLYERSQWFGSNINNLEQEGVVWRILKPNYCLSEIPANTLVEVEGYGARRTTGEVGTIFGNGRDILTNGVFKHLSIGERAWHLLPGDWVPWFGGKCPLPDWVDYEVKCYSKDGTILSYKDFDRSSWIDVNHNWEHRGSAINIIAYRVIGIKK